MFKRFIIVKKKPSSPPFIFRLLLLDQSSVAHAYCALAPTQTEGAGLGRCTIHLPLGCDVMKTISTHSLDNFFLQAIVKL